MKLHERATGEAAKYIDAKVKQLTTVGPYVGRHQGKKMSVKQATRAALEIARRRGLKGAPPARSALVLKAYGKHSGRDVSFVKKRKHHSEDMMHEDIKKARKVVDVRSKGKASPWPHLRNSDMMHADQWGTLTPAGVRAQKHQRWMQNQPEPSRADTEAEAKAKKSLAKPKTLGSKINKYSDDDEDDFGHKILRPRQTGGGRRIIKKPLPKSEDSNMSLADRVLGNMGEDSSLYGRILGEGKKVEKSWGHSDFQTKIKSKKPWGATAFQTKVRSEDTADLFGLVDSLVELRNSIIQK